MEEFGKIILEFLITFIFIFMLDFYLTFKKKKKFNRKTAPANIKYLMYKYNLDIAKLGYLRICKVLAHCDSLEISILFISTRFVDNVYIRLIIASILVFPLFAGVYHLIAMHYKKESEK